VAARPVADHGSATREEDSVKTDPFDLANLRLPPELQTGARTVTASKSRHQPFVKFPWSWADRLRTNRGTTYRVAIHLLYEHWRGGGRPIQLSNVALSGQGVRSKSKWRALHELESAGLIRVERRARRSPVVYVLLE
jgi:hypothetical protein